MNLAVIYARVSTDAQVNTPSLDVQEAQARGRAESLGATVAGVYRDEGVSGALYHARPGLQESLSAIGRLRVDYPAARLIFVCSRLDRAGRDVGGLVLIRRRLRAVGAELHLADGMSTPDTAAGNLVGNTLGVIAEFERELIRERTMAGKRAAAAAGLQPQRTRRPFGYRIVQRADIYPGSGYSEGDAGRYVLVPEEASVARELFTRYGAGSLSLRGAARWLHEEGVPTVSGGTWAAATVWHMLSNPVYKGQARFGWRSWWREEQEDGTVRQRSRRLSPDLWSSLPCPAIVDAATWERVQARLSTNQRTFSGDPSRRHLLSGLARCPVCGRAMRATRSGGAGVHYVCPQSKPSASVGAVVCNPRHYRADWLEPLVVNTLATIASEPERILRAVTAFDAQSQTRRRPKPGRVTDLAAIDARERAAVEAEINAIAQGRDTAPYRRLLGEIERERAATMAAIAGAQDSPSLRIDPEELTRRVAGLSDVLAEEALPAADRIRLIRLLVSAVVPVDKAGVAEIVLAPMTPGATVERVTIRATVHGVERVEVRYP